MGFWDSIRKAFGGKHKALEMAVRQAMLARVANNDVFTALDIANEVTQYDANRTADDLREASAVVLQLFNQNLLFPFGYITDASGIFRPGSGAPPAAGKGAAPATAGNVSAIPATGDLRTRVLTAIQLRAGRRQSMNHLDVVFDVTKVGAPDFDQATSLARSLMATELPRAGYFHDGNIWRPPGFQPPVFGQQPAFRGVAPAVQQQRGPAAPPPKMESYDGYQANPAIMGLTAAQTRERSLRINPYRTAWIGRVDTIPPQNDERTALIDRGLVLRGLMTETQLADIHRVGDAWLRFHEADKLAKLAAAKSADEAISRIRAEHVAKVKAKKEVAAAKEKARVEGVARRKSEDIIFLGRGVSKGLADRRSNIEALQRQGLPIWSTPADVAKAFSLSISKLRWLCFHSEATEKTHYFQFEVPKRSGGTRKLAAPHETLKAAQRFLLANVLEKIALHEAAHGFVKGRSTVSNARIHVKRDVVVNVDLKDFFPTVTFRRVRGLFQKIGYSPAVATVLALLSTEAPRREVDYAGQKLWVAVGERALPQGAPTSPAISNLVSRRLDVRLTKRLAKKGWTYTRYADDLSFSSTGFSREAMGFLHASIRHVVEDEGFALNPKKGRVHARSSRQQVTGIVVNEKLSVPREEIRRLRAILHQANKSGLESQNREKRPDFRAYLQGLIAYVTMVDRAKGEKLLAALSSLPK